MKVVVPIDNTPATQSMFDVLMGMKWYEGTEMILVTVVPRWTSSPDAGAAIPSSLREIESLAVELRNALPFCEVTFFIREGDPKIEIVSFAREVGAQLIVTATAPSTTNSRFFGADIAESIITHAHCPVFVAKTSYDTISDAQSGFNTVLVPIDDSLYADIAIQWLLNFQWTPQTRFVLASVLEHHSARLAAEESLLGRAQLLSTVLHTKNIFMDVRTGGPTDGIISLAHQYGADLIVIGSHGRIGLQKLIFGSVSEELARIGPCSIAIVRGIAQPDENWHRSGVFRKPKFEDTATRYPSTRDYSAGGDDSPHILPGGMH